MNAVRAGARYASLQPELAGGNTEPEVVKAVQNIVVYGDPVPAVKCETNSAWLGAGECASDPGTWGCNSFSSGFRARFSLLQDQIGWPSNGYVSSHEDAFQMKRRGQSLVETSLILAAFLGLLLGMVSIGQMLFVGRLSASACMKGRAGAQ